MVTVPPSPASSPFSRLVSTHMLSVGAEACVAVALAGSLFFSVPAGEARPKVILYLLLTFAPFIVVGPILGPALDRTSTGRRFMVTACAVGRAVLCALMARHVDGLLLFPEAFGVLVASKGYAIAKSAIVPAVVADRDLLVEANSRLALVGVVGGFLAGVPAAGLLKVLGPTWVLALGAVLSSAAAVASLRIPASTPERAPLSGEARRELHSATVLLAASAMTILRGGVGFTTFLVAFVLKRSHEPDWVFGLVLAAAATGGLVGAVLAPPLRRKLREELILAGALVVASVPALAGARQGGVAWLVVVAFALGVSASGGKLAFDSLIQRDAPDAVRGRLFAQFETRLQFAWVVGAAVPVILSLGERVGLLGLSIALAATGLSYFGSTTAASRYTHTAGPAQ